MLIVWLLAAIAAGAFTWILGWWGVVVAAFLVGVLHWKCAGLVWIVALSAIAAWSVLLLADSAGGRFNALSASIAGVMKIPAALLVVVTLLFAGLLAWSAAVVGSEIGRLIAREPVGDPTRAS